MYRAMHGSWSSKNLPTIHDAMKSDCHSDKRCMLNERRTVSIIYTVNLGNFGRFSQLFPNSASQKVGMINPTQSSEQVHLVLHTNTPKLSIGYA